MMMAMVNAEDNEMTCLEDPKSDLDSLVLEGGGSQNAPLIRSPGGGMRVTSEKIR